MQYEETQEDEGKSEAGHPEVRNKEDDMEVWRNVLDLQRCVFNQEKE